MINLIKFVFVITLSVILFACEKTKKNNTGNADTTVVSDSAKTDSALSIEISEHAPSWFVSLPEKEGYIYTTGLAKSRRANISSDKALMMAQVSLAEKLKKQDLNSGINEDDKPIGADSDPDNNNLSITMQDVIVKNKKQIKDGDLWYTFILLELKQEK